MPAKLVTRARREDLSGAFWHLLRRPIFFGGNMLSGCPPCTKRSRKVDSRTILLLLRVQAIVLAKGFFNLTYVGSFYTLLKQQYWCTCVKPHLLWSPRHSVSSTGGTWGDLKRFSQNLEQSMAYLGTMGDAPNSPGESPNVPFLKDYSMRFLCPVDSSMYFLCTSPWFL